MLTSTHKEALNRWLEPLAKVVAGTGVSPNTITLIVPVLTGFSCLWFIRSRAVLPFCALVLVVGSLDGLDGAVARAGGRATKFGAYLDAMMDRCVEVMVMLTVAYVTGYWLLSSVVLALSMLVSYAKARAAMEVPVNNLEWPDLAERAERSLIFIAGLASAALFPWKPLGHDLFWWTLVLLAVLVGITVAQRVFRAKRYIQDREAAR